MQQHIRFEVHDSGTSYVSASVNLVISLLPAEELVRVNTPTSLALLKLRKKEERSVKHLQALVEGGEKKNFHTFLASLLISCRDGENYRAVSKISLRKIIVSIKEASLFSIKWKLTCSQKHLSVFREDDEGWVGTCRRDISRNCFAASYRVRWWQHGGNARRADNEDQNQHRYLRGLREDAC